ncbi:binding-protein-dependent transport systems inner membrane component [Candidatus Vecturithrix granuli]|uniref:Binding-protein-dependent transport systems inner membrane component n=1 Tax=Vecturithrix granuli TaxID=1499967 RepID=A0A081C0C7_VECG1|nr:binding-protein-dependent transport systems inner membrane component [Candidatus Vecturithrix granuli]
MDIVFFKRLAKSKQIPVGACIVLINLILALFAPLIATHAVDDMDFAYIFAKPGEEGHLLGTDDYGRDIFSRIVYGSRISLMVGVIAVGIGAFLGTVLGIFAGYFGGFFDALMMRIMDALFSFPYVLLAIAMMAVLGAGLFNAMLAIGIVMVPSFARVVRSATLNVKHEEFIISARCMGAKHVWIILDHVLPNIIPTIIIYASLNFAGAVISEATLSFLGLGIQPPTPSWGSMLSEAKNYLQTAPYMAYFPGLAILITCLGFNLLGDGLRDVLDPRLRQ